MGEIARRTLKETELKPNKALTKYRLDKSQKFEKERHRLRSKPIQLAGQ
jgi:hypothetical protein